MATAGSSVRTFIDVLIPHPRAAWLSRVRDLLLILGGSLLVAALAQLSIPMQPVPFTGQTLGVLLVGAVLGGKRGGLAMVAYLAEGLAGLPVFANGAAGEHVLVGPTGGYLVSFVLAAALVGTLAEHGWDHSPWLMALAMVAGNLVIYLCGVTWLAHVLHLSFTSAITYGMVVFLLTDAIKIVIAMIALPAAWALSGRRNTR